MCSASKLESARYHRSWDEPYKVEDGDSFDDYLRLEVALQQRARYTAKLAISGTLMPDNQLIGNQTEHLDACLLAQ